MQHEAPTLEVDLAALAANYRLLQKKSAAADCAAVVKADAYGLGAARVAPALAQAGCDTFFVATLDEGIVLRAILPDATIYIFHGVNAQESQEFIAHRLRPVLSSMEQLECWETVGALTDDAKAGLHVDTGMCRLGLDIKQGMLICADSYRLERAGIAMVMSHLACASEPAHEKNTEQLAQMRGIAALLPKDMPVSFSNSAGIFLGDAYHFQLLRPGCSLYGITPNAAEDNPMAHVATLRAPILQVREIGDEQTVGYGATATVPAGQRLATVALGYADGWTRSLGGKVQGFMEGHPVPQIGRISMDLTIFDITNVPKKHVQPGAMISLICPEQPVDTIAEAAETIGYEIFTRLGPRVRRVYVEHGQAA